jgi:hypothetical protein
MYSSTSRALPHAGTSADSRRSSRSHHPHKRERVGELRDAPDREALCVAIEVHIRATWSSITQTPSSPSTQAETGRRICSCGIFLRGMGELASVDGEGALEREPGRAMWDLYGDRKALRPIRCVPKFADTFTLMWMVWNDSTPANPRGVPRGGKAAKWTSTW